MKRAQSWAVLEQLIFLPSLKFFFLTSVCLKEIHTKVWNFWPCSSTVTGSPSLLCDDIFVSFNILIFPPQYSHLLRWLLPLLSSHWTFVWRLFLPHCVSAEVRRGVHLHFDISSSTENLCSLLLFATSCWCSCLRSCRQRQSGTVLCGFGDSYILQRP